MGMFGWFKAAKVLITAIIPPILCYSGEIWPGVTRKVMEELENT